MTDAEKKEALEENRASEALTVLWMLSSVATLAGQGVALIAWVVAWWVAQGPMQNAARLLSGWFLLSAIGTGLLSLVLIPPVYRVRQQKPPFGIVVGVVAISITPILMMVLWIVLRG